MGFVAYSVDTLLCELPWTEIFYWALHTDEMS